MPAALVPASGRPAPGQRRPPHAFSVRDAGRAAGHHDPGRSAEKVAAEAVRSRALVPGVAVLAEPNPALAHPSNNSVISGSASV